jgi:hypothetical protein
MTTATHAFGGGEDGACDGRGGDGGHRGSGFCCGEHRSQPEATLSREAEVALLEQQIEAARARLEELRRH